jgi:hypothetical protein
MNCGASKPQIVEFLPAFSTEILLFAQKFAWHGGCSSKIDSQLQKVR